jgi:amidophosphoribosyltransferase
MHENCGVVAVVDLAGKENVVPLAVKMAEGLQHRGELGAGLAWLNDRKGIQVLKDHGLVKDVLSLDRLQQAQAQGPAAIAHTRYATNTLLHQCMVQPYHYPQGESPQEFAFAFNGNIANCDAHTEKLRSMGHPPRIEGDTELIGRTIIAGMQKHTAQNTKRVLRELGQLDGAYNIVMLDPSGTVTALRDQHGFHPLTYARNGSLFAVASEDAAIRSVWPNADIANVLPGSMVQGYGDGREVKHQQLWVPDPRICFFEAVYFASHRSRIDGASVANVRYECGKILAEMDADRPTHDIVVPVPESAKIAANGYADTRRLRRVDAILRNHNVGRTFTSPADRGLKAAMKYDIDSTLLNGKSVMLIDDSLVRGTTMRVLVKQLRDRGTAEIHLRLASPPIVSPCFYGIDFPTAKELLATKYNNGAIPDGGVLPDDVLAAIAEDLGVDSIRYLPVAAIPRALGKDQEEICMACVTGEYPTDEGRRLSLLVENPLPKAC